MAADTKTATSETSLDAQLTAKRAELLEAQKNLGNTLQNPHTIKAIRKDIARILTKINAPATLNRVKVKQSAKETK